MKKVVILVTDDNKGYWSIYSQDGTELALDFESEEEAEKHALDCGWKRVDNFKF